MTITPDRKLTNQFPRTDAAPMHSSKYWAKEKDRLLRQLLIGDIEQTTGRELITYFAQLDEGINHTDPDDLSEIIEGVTTGHIDLFIQTPGGECRCSRKVHLRAQPARGKLPRHRPELGQEWGDGNRDISQEHPVGR